MQSVMIDNDISDISFYFRSKQGVRIEHCIGLSKMKLWLLK